MRDMRVWLQLFVKRRVAQLVCSCYMYLLSSTQGDAVMFVCCYSPDLQSPINLNNGYVSRG
jgi:hypothetical protein